MNISRTIALASLVVSTMLAEKPEKSPTAPSAKLTDVPWIKGQPVLLSDAPLYVAMESSYSVVAYSTFSEPTDVTIGNGSEKPVLTIKLATGEVVFGEGITPTEAAKQFAEALKKIWPSIVSCKDKP